MINCVLNRFRVMYTLHIAHYGKSATIPESNHGSGVCKEHYAECHVPKHSTLLAGTGVWKLVLLHVG